MEFRLPELGEGVYEAEFVSWQVKVGEEVKSGQPLLEVMTDKATMEVPSPFAGRITSLNLEPGQTVKVGASILTYEPTGAGSATPVTSAQPGTATATKTAARSQPDVNHRGNSVVGVKAAPSVRVMARQMGVTLDDVRGSGPEGRILIEDLSRHLEQRPITVPSKPEKREPALDLGKPGTTVKLIGLRGKIADQMVRSLTTIPHYSYVDECEVTALVQLRASLKDQFSEAGIRLTYLPFFVKAATRALKDVPMVNATTDEEAREVTLHGRYDVGVAVAGPQGLIVPVIRDADQKSIPEIAREIERLSEDARRNRVRRDDLGGGTFTVTSVGNIGGLFSTPVINHPEVGILGIGKIIKRPAFDEHENVIAGQFVYFSLSFDHRIVDGAVGATFGNALIHHLQAPATLLVDSIR